MNRCRPPAPGAAQSQAERYQAWLHREIPLTADIGVELRELEPLRIVASAPLAPNHNVHYTAFAGSLYALAIVTGWTLVLRYLESQEIDADLVTRDGTIRYLEPVEGELVCRGTLDDPAALDRFHERLDADGRSRLCVNVELTHPDGHAVATLDAVYTAVLLKPGKQGG
ncbi:MAG TPA: YiiD C-terminal domain-containing protein [Gammaproteobacteria bacterium]